MHGVTPRYSPTVSRTGRHSEVGPFAALASIVLASNVGAATDSPTVLVAVAVIVVLALLYLVYDGRLIRREQARRAEESRRRREALGVPDWNPRNEG